MFECGNESCKKEVKQLRKGLCQACYRRQMRNGTTDYRTVLELSADAILSNMERVGDCFIWKGAIDKDGYPRYYDPTVRAETGEGLVYIRRWLVGAKKGEIVEDSCDNRLCVNANHLSKATTGTGKNTMAGINSVKTHCDKGHELTEENVYLRKNGARSCRKCASIASRKNFFKSTYGISIEEFDQKIIDQEGLCPICSRPLESGKQSMGAVMDHDHLTLKNRGVLHSKCNIGLGHFEENIDFLQGAIDYIKKHS
jgi:hypothetical protein